MRNYLRAQRSITDDWANLVTDGKDAEYRKIRSNQGQQAADAWLATQPKRIQRIIKMPRI